MSGTVPTVGRANLRTVLSAALAGTLSVGACGGEDNADLFGGGGGTAARDASVAGKSTGATGGSGGTQAGGSSGTLGTGGASTGGSSAGNGGGQSGAGGTNDASAGSSGRGGTLGADASTNRDSAAEGAVGASGAKGSGGSAGAVGAGGNAGSVGSAGTAGSAGAPDAGNDGGPTGSTPGQVLCGSDLCDLPGSVCCVGGLTMASCFPIITGCVNFGAPVRCDERADCSNGQRCCGERVLGGGSNYTASCRNNCEDPSVPFCRTDQECSGGTTCKPIVGLETFSACQS